MQWSNFYQKHPKVCLAAVMMLAMLLFYLFLHLYIAYRRPMQSSRKPSSMLSRYLVQYVTKPLTMTVFVPDGHVNRQRIEVLMKLYASSNSQISYRIVDPERESLMAQQAGYHAPGNVLLDYDGRQRLVERPLISEINQALSELKKNEAPPR